MHPLAPSDALLVRPPSSGHLLRFYRNDEELAETVGAYLAAGLRAGQACIVVATPAHREAFAANLTAMGLDVVYARAHGLLLEADASESLELLLSEGTPSWARFEPWATSLLSAAKREAKGSGVRAYGEMVDLLWQDAKLTAALQLERLWDRVLALHGLPLLCAYRVDVLGQADQGCVDRMLGAHSHLLPGAAALDEAVGSAVDQVLGFGTMQRLEPLIRANAGRGAELPRGEAAIFWLRNNLPDACDPILDLVRLKVRGCAFLEGVG